MFPVGSFVKITDISECKKVELNEVFKVLSSSKSMTVIENKDGINLGGYYSWRFVAVDPVADATKSQAADTTKTIADDDWFYFDNTIHADHILRQDIDQIDYGNNDWIKINASAGIAIKGGGGYLKYRCKKCHAPKEIATTVAEGDWVIIDKSIYGHLTTRTIDECNYQNTKWNPVLNTGFQYNFHKDYEFRCKRSDLPVADATESQAANAAEVTQPTNVQNKDAKMFKNRFEVGQKILCTDGACAKRITNGKEYVVINNDYDNNGSGMDMLEVINDNGNKERYFVYRFSAASAEDTAVTEKVAAKRRVVAKVTNSYLTRGQSYEVVDDRDGTTVIVGPNSHSLCFMDDCFESDISLSDVTNVDDATGTKENEMKKETAVKVASVVGKFAAGWGFRALNYWVFEPAAGIGRPIMKSVRYATFLGSLAALGYGYYHPQEVKDALVSCLPTVSIEAPAILSGK